MVFDVKKIMPHERRELSKEIQESYVAHYAKIMQERFNYARTPENAAVFDRIAAYIGVWYAARKGQCDYPERGLFLFGESGTGKTTAMQIFSGLCEVDYITVGELTKRFALGSFKLFWTIADEYANVPLIIDDLGCEDFTKSYGNDIPLADFIREREIAWLEKGICTFFTSNAKSRDDVIKRYGESVCSRLLGMCDFIQFKGNDNRLKR